MKKVVFLKGGFGAEREVSMISAPRIEDAIRKAGHDLVAVDVQPPGAGVIRQIVEARPDCVFNGLYGHYGENGVVQGVLTFLGIPFTHSGVMASALAMDKEMTKALLVPEGIPMPAGRTVSREELLAWRDGKVPPPLAWPFVVKPVAEGSSVGVTIVHRAQDLAAAAEICKDARVLVEEYIAGQDLFVALLDGKAQGIVEVEPVRGFYDLKAKYYDPETRHIMPANVPDAVAREAMDLSERAFVRLGCRGMARTDLRYDATRSGQKLFLLELNTQPGLTPSSLLPEVLAYNGTDFDTLVAWAIDHARCT
jgi:D-alanine-D-alanine ligase